MTPVRLLAFFLIVACAPIFGQQPVSNNKAKAEDADCNDKAHGYWDAPASFWEKFYKECPPKQVRTLNGEPVYESRGDLRPILLEHPIPALPRDSQSASAEVRLAAIVDKTGQVVDAIIARSSGDNPIDALAMRTVKTWRFKPAKRNGKDVAVQENLIVVFDRDRT